MDILQGGGTVTKSFEVEGEAYQGVFFSLGEITGGRIDYIVNFRSMRFLKEASQLTLIQATAVAFLALSIIGQFIFWISRRVTRPLAELTRLTRRMAELDFSEKVPVRGTDEIALLGTSFNELTEALQSNIAEKDRYAAQLADLNADLEHQVARRTEELHHSNLRLKREIAEKNDFLRAVSHDLGAPLRNIGGLIQLVEKKYAEPLGESGRDKLARIRQNVQRGLVMIRQILELSQMKTRPVRPIKIDLMRLLSQIRDDYSAILEERGIRFVVLDVLPQITASPDRIRQLFQNLVDNAVKYLGDQSEPEISIGWSQEPEEYLFWISDNGIGIPPEKKNEIFGVFRRIHHRDIIGVDGMGIGLATVKSVVEMYGGDIWVESEPGKGSTFYFTMKRSLVDAPETEEKATTEGDINEMTKTYA
jgi:signal transduction histidine kinase